MHSYNTMQKSWVVSWGQHMKSALYKDIESSQKINHFPGSFDIGRKDRLSKNMLKMQVCMV